MREPAFPQPETTHVEMPSALQQAGVLPNFHATHKAAQPRLHFDAPCWSLLVAHRSTSLAGLQSCLYKKNLCNSGRSQMDRVAHPYCRDKFGRDAGHSPSSTEAAPEMRARSV